MCIDTSTRAHTHIQMYTWSQQENPSQNTQWQKHKAITGNNIHSPSSLHTLFVSFVGFSISFGFHFLRPGGFQIVCKHFQWRCICVFAQRVRECVTSEKVNFHDLSCRTLNRRITVKKDFNADFIVCAYICVVAIIVVVVVVARWAKHH